MMTIKKHLSKYYYEHVHGSALGFRLRRFIETAPIAELKPFNGLAAISDLFVWRQNDEWETEFELFNITSFVYPADMPEERCEMVFFDADGREISRQTLTLAPLERRTLKISDYLDGRQGVGTFSIFHHSALSPRFEARGSHLTERGYVGYRRKGTKLRSFCHGNLQSLSQAPDQKNYSYVAATTQPMRYHPQLILSDCRRAELIYTNPSSKARALEINFFDHDGHKISDQHIIVPARGVRLVGLDNTDGKIHTFDNKGAIVMWRPVIVKYYDTHFDVMHG
jgi:hypothetical protein